MRSVEEVLPCVLCGGWDGGHFLSFWVCLAVRDVGLVLSARFGSKCNCFANLLTWRTIDGFAFMISQDARMKRDSRAKVH